VSESRQRLVFGQRTDIGKIRSNNEDAVFAKVYHLDGRPEFGLFIIADGMGGSPEGEKAARIAIETTEAEIIRQMSELPSFTDLGKHREDIPQILTLAVQKANIEVVKNAQHGGSTLTLAVIMGDSAYIAHVGDTRAYLILQNSRKPITTDHTFGEKLVEVGAISREDIEAGIRGDHRLYRALGWYEDNIPVDTFRELFLPDSYLLLSSDGLTRHVKVSEFPEIIARSASPQDACDQLVALANERGGEDNISVIVIQAQGES